MSLQQSSFIHRAVWAPEGPGQIPLLRNAVTGSEFLSLNVVVSAVLCFEHVPHGSGKV